MSEVMTNRQVMTAVAAALKVGQPVRITTSHGVKQCGHVLSTENVASAINARFVVQTSPTEERTYYPTSVINVEPCEVRFKKSMRKVSKDYVGRLTTNSLIVGCQIISHQTILDLAADIIKMREARNRK